MKTKAKPTIPFRSGPVQTCAHCHNSTRKYSTVLYPNDRRFHFCGRESCTHAYIDDAGGPTDGFLTIPADPTTTFDLPTRGQS